MSEKELEIFRKLDDKLYLINKNNTYKQIFKKMENNINPDNVQRFINRLAGWYLVKYPDKNIELYLQERYDEIDYMQEKIMPFNKLIFGVNKLIPVDADDALLYYKQLIIMAGWGMIYSKNTIPEYGYFRIKKMFEEFNDEFNLELNLNIYNSVMTADYSENNPDIVRLLGQKKEQEVKERRFARIKKLFRR